MTPAIASLPAAALATPAGDRLSNIVFMGLGEPLANYDNVLASVEIINADWGMGIGARAPAPVRLREKD